MRVPATRNTVRQCLTCPNLASSAFGIFYRQTLCDQCYTEWMVAIKNYSYPIAGLWSKFEASKRVQRGQRIAAMIRLLAAQVTL